MKVKAIARAEEDYTRERSSDLTKVHRNLDPALHPLQRATEYTRAVAAVKLAKVFAKPFFGALSGHSDGLTCLARNPRAIGQLLSGAADGEVLLWDVPNQRAVASLRAHTRAVRGVACAPDGRHAVSAGDDASVRLWQLPGSDGGLSGVGPPLAVAPLATYYGKNAFRDADHHWRKAQFVTCGATVELWDHERSAPVAAYTWGADTVMSVRFNPSEPDIFASCGSDRSIALYDVRADSPLRKLIMLKRANKVAWNPREAFNFTVASEDNNLYSFDMRKLDIATNVHKDFVSVRSQRVFCVRGRHLMRHAGCDGRGLLAHRPRVCCWLVRPLRAHLRVQRWPQPRGVPHQAHAAVRCARRLLLRTPAGLTLAPLQRVRCALQRRRRVRVQRQRGHERAHLEG